jgi:hypothetical protein
MMQKIQVFWNMTPCQLFSLEYFKEIIVRSSSDIPVKLLDPEDEGTAILRQSFSAVYTDLLAALQKTL